MNISVLGWGSLVWCPGDLRIKTRWRMDGPHLPIEFARISGGDRLTLVIHEGSKDQPALWAMSTCEGLGEARENLKKREGCTSLQPIHALARDDKAQGEISESVKASVEAWLDAHREIDAVIWTGLKSNWDEKRSREFCFDDAIQYLKCLAANQRSAAAEEYIRNAPAQINTALRGRIENELGWPPAKLADDLFDQVP